MQKKPKANKLLWTFVLTATRAFLSVCQYPAVNKLAPKIEKLKGEEK